MSTYLVAWVVGPLELTDAGRRGRRRAARRARSRRGHLTRFALDIGAFAIKFFADYYGIPYPGEKCDLVALPDFSFGAMENLGCVTFREARLLLDPDQVTLERGERRRAHDRARDRAHVVRRPRDDEVVERHLAQRSVRDLHGAPRRRRVPAPSGRPGTTSRWAAPPRSTSTRSSNTRTVEYEVITPEDADGMFDLLTYQKGGSVLRMVERWLGADAFRAGVRHYLDRYQLGNTETTDLWDSLKSATGEPVRRIMDSWIFQPGLPARRRARRRRCRHDHAAALHLRGTATHRNGGSSPCWRGCIRRRPRRRSRCCSTATRRRSMSPPTRSSCSTPVARASTASPYPGEWRDQLLDAAVLEPLERFALVDDLWASVLAGQRARGSTCSRSPASCAAKTISSCGESCSACCAVLRRLVDGEALDSPARRSRRRARADVRTLGLGSARIRRRPDPPAARHRARRDGNARGGSVGHRPGA